MGVWTICFVEKVFSVQFVNILSMRKLFWKKFNHPLWHFTSNFPHYCYFWYCNHRNCNPCSSPSCFRPTCLFLNFLHAWYIPAREEIFILQNYKGCKAGYSFRSKKGPNLSPLNKTICFLTLSKHTVFSQLWKLLFSWASNRWKWSWQNQMSKRFKCP